MKLVHFMLEKVCEQAAIWQQKGIPIKVSFNSSIREFRDKNMVKTIRNMLDKYNCSPKLLQIEFTEKFALEAEAEKSIIGQMQTLQQDGVVFILDDFGTGYASLRYLQLLPISKLKIDKSFVSSIMQQEKLQKLVQGLIQFGQSLDVDVVAEGVETEEQYELVKTNGLRFRSRILYKPPNPSRRSRSTFKIEQTKKTVRIFFLTVLLLVFLLLSPIIA